MRHNYLIVFLFTLVFAAACNSEENTDNKDLTLDELTENGQNASDNSAEESDEQSNRAVELSAGEDFYAHFNLPEKNIIANLRASGSELFLMLSLPEKSEIISLNGSFASDSKFKVKGVAEGNGQQPQYSGKITPDYALEITNDNTGEKYLLHQDYSGGLPFKAHSFEKEAETDAGTFSDKMYLLVPAGNSDLKSEIFKIYFDKKTGTPEKLLQAYHESLFETFKKDEMGGFWNREISSEVLFNSHGIVAYGIHEFSYTGGAHGNGSSIFLVYDVKNNKPVVLNDVFSESDIAALSEKIYTQIKKERGLTDDEMRSEYDLPIAPTDNFYFTPKGIHFYYNAYDLTSYAMGPDAVFFSFDELKQSFNSSFAKRISSN